MTLVEAKPRSAGDDVARAHGAAVATPAEWGWAQIKDVARLRGEKVDPTQEGAPPYVPSETGVCSGELLALTPMRFLEPRFL